VEFRRKLGGRLSVIVENKNGTAVGYVCDGKLVESWLVGPLAPGSVQPVGRNGDMLTGTFSGTAVTGVVTVQGKARPFTALPVGGGT